MDDVRVVMDAAGSDRATLVGISEGGALRTIMAATYPERVSSLVLLSPACPGLFDPELALTIPDLMAADWSTGRVLDALVQHPPDRHLDPGALARLERYTCTPVVAAETMRPNLESDIRQVIPTVTVPTLVLHSTGDPVVPVARGEYYAEHIPGATLVAVNGDFHGSWRRADYDPFVREVQTFLTGESPRPAGPAYRVLSTVLFTDIVNSTVLAAELGDARWRKILDGHDDAARHEVSAYGGILVKSTGDGILARFDGPSRAVAEVDFVDRGEHDLKGIPDAWQLYATTV